MVASRGSKTSLYSWYALGVLVLVCTFSFIDRQILSILAEKIKHDLVLTDTQLGLLYGTMFAIFYTIFSVPLGRLADRSRRVTIIGLGLAFWSLMTVLSGLADSYAGLALARMGVGVGEASASPAAFSLLAAYFASQRRAVAMATYQAGVYLGMGLSLPIGGWLSTRWDAAFPTGGPIGLVGWQAAFVFIGLPGIVLAGWVLTLREPPRADPDRPVEAGRSVWPSFFADVASILPPFTIWRASRVKGALGPNLAVAAGAAIFASALTVLTGDLVQWAAWSIAAYGVFTWSQTLKASDPQAHRLIWRRPEVPLAMIATGGLAIVTYAVSFWSAPFAIRTFGVDAAAVGAAIGLPGAVASACGVVLGGYVSDSWKRRDPRGRIFTCMMSAALPVPLIVLMFRASEFDHYVLFSAAVFLLANLWAGSIVAIFQDLVVPRMFGTISAIYLLSSTMIGLALGPYLSGKVATITGSLQAGVFSLLAAPPIVFVALWVLSRRIARADDAKPSEGLEGRGPAPAQ